MKQNSLILVVFMVFYSQIALSQVQGPLYQVDVRGIPMNCTSHFGEPVAVYLNYQLNNVGVATRQYNGVPAIILNPNVINQFSNIVAQWWFAHECAHHALHPQWNSESNADCFAVKQLVQFGFINHPNQLSAFYNELASLPGSSMGHLPGPVRAQNIASCAIQ